jgi:hypothetical protein
MKDRFCPNCQQYVRPQESGGCTQIGWLLLAAGLAAAAYFAVLPLYPSGHARNGMTAQDVGLLAATGVGTVMVVVATINIYRDRHCPICKSRRLR